MSLGILITLVFYQNDANLRRNQTIINTFIKA